MIHKCHECNEIGTHRAFNFDESQATNKPLEECTVYFCQKHYDELVEEGTEEEVFEEA